MLFDLSDEIKYDLHTTLWQIIQITK
uniref:Uncharacterized protein n=1 Tax=Rhizophora mucronata TaxID=61149 RepID=A0A2P2N042_RHIMU